MLQDSLCSWVSFPFVSLLCLEVSVRKLAVTVLEALGSLSVSSISRLLCCARSLVDASAGLWGFSPSRSSCPRDPPHPTWAFLSSCRQSPLLFPVVLECIRLPLPTPTFTLRWKFHPFVAALPGCPSARTPAPASRRCPLVQLPPHLAWVPSTLLCLDHHPLLQRCRHHPTGAPSLLQVDSGVTLWVLCLQRCPLTNSSFYDCFFHHVTSEGYFPGEGNGKPLQCSCLENPMDRGAWRATVYGIVRVGHDLTTKPPPPPPFLEGRVIRQQVSCWDELKPAAWRRTTLSSVQFSVRCSHLRHQLWQEDLQATLTSDHVAASWESWSPLRFNDSLVTHTTLLVIKILLQQRDTKQSHPGEQTHSARSGGPQICEAPIVLSPGSQEYISRPGSLCDNTERRGHGSVSCICWCCVTWAWLIGSAATWLSLQPPFLLDVGRTACGWKPQLSSRIVVLRVWPVPILSHLLVVYSLGYHE